MQHRQNEKVDPIAPPVRRVLSAARVRRYTASRNVQERGEDDGAACAGLDGVPLLEQAIELSMAELSVSVSISASAAAPPTVATYVGTTTRATGTSAPCRSGPALAFCGAGYYRCGPGEDASQGLYRREVPPPPYPYKREYLKEDTVSPAAEHSIVP